MNKILELKIVKKIYPSVLTYVLGAQTKEPVLAEK